MMAFGADYVELIENAQSAIEALLDACPPDSWGSCLSMSLRTAHACLCDTHVHSEELSGPIADLERAYQDEVA